MIINKKAENLNFNKTEPSVETVFGSNVTV